MRILSQSQMVTYSVSPAHPLTRASNLPIGFGHLLNFLLGLPSCRDAVIILILPRRDSNSKVRTLTWCLLGPGRLRSATGLFPLFTCSLRGYLSANSSIRHKSSCPLSRSEPGGRGCFAIEGGSTGYARYAAEQSTSSFAFSVFTIPIDSKSPSSFFSLSVFVCVRTLGDISSPKNTMPWLI